MFDRRRTGRLRSRLLHYTYWSYDQYFDKYQRYVKWRAEDMWDRGQRTGVYGLLISPFLRFFQLYVLRLGVLDGLVGVQCCMLQAFFVSFVKQARLWEMEHARKQSDDVPATLCTVPNSAEPRNMPHVASRPGGPSVAEMNPSLGG
jgi:hypothetical protein